MPLLADGLFTKLCLFETEILTGDLTGDSLVSSVIMGGLMPLKLLTDVHVFLLPTNQQWII